MYTGYPVSAAWYCSSFNFYRPSWNFSPKLGL